jgi:hypothetical protein
VLVAACGSPPQPVFGDPAGPWQDRPVPIPDAMAVAALAACREGHAVSGTSTLAVIDARGENRVDLVATGPGNTVEQCTAIRNANGSFTMRDGAGSSGFGPDREPGPGGIVVDTLDARDDDGLGGSAARPTVLVVGRVGADVRGLELILTSGTHVRASAANGRFVAWWPSRDVVDSVLLVGPDGAPQGSPFLP